jgi:hypothetical protein
MPGAAERTKIRHLADHVVTALQKNHCWLLELFIIRSPECKTQPLRVQVRHGWEGKSERPITTTPALAT